MMVVDLIVGLISTAGVIDSEYRGARLFFCYNYVRKTMIVKKNR